MIAWTDDVAILVTRKDSQPISDLMKLYSYQKLKHAPYVTYVTSYKRRKFEITPEY